MCASGVERLKHFTQTADKGLLLCFSGNFVHIFFATFISLIPLKGSENFLCHWSTTRGAAPWHRKWLSKSSWKGHGLTQLIRYNEEWEQVRNTRFALLCKSITNTPTVGNISEKLSITVIGTLIHFSFICVPLWSNRHECSQRSFTESWV